MTSAPQGILSARLLLNKYLKIPLVALGITGDDSHWGGYHCGKDRVVEDDYSVIESSRDRAGLSDDASALDIGQFAVFSKGHVWTLRDFSVWLAAECAAGAPDTTDIREVIYSPDGVTVKRWDRLKRRSSGDSSHLFHTHISEFRDARGRKMVALLTRWLVHIGLIGDSDMALDAIVPASGNRNVGTVLSDIWGSIATGHSGYVPTARMYLNGQLDALSAKLDLIASKVDIDPTELAQIEAAAKAGAASAADDIVARILAGLPEGTLTKEQVAEAIREVFGGLDETAPQS